MKSIAKIIFIAFFAFATIVSCGKLSSDSNGSVSNDNITIDSNVDNSLFATWKVSTTISNNYLLMEIGRTKITFTTYINGNITGQFIASKFKITNNTITFLDDKNNSDIFDYEFINNNSLEMTDRNIGIAKEFSRL